MFDTVIGGHITLLFTVEKDGRLLRNQGSRGIGFNVDHGVRASVFETKSSQNQIEQKLLKDLIHLLILSYKESRIRVV